MIYFKETNETHEIENLMEGNSVYSNKMINECSYMLMINRALEFYLVRGYQNRICTLTYSEQEYDESEEIKLPTNYIVGDVYYEGEFCEVTNLAFMEDYNYTVFKNSKLNLIQANFEKTPEELSQEVCVKINSNTFIGVVNNRITNVWIKYKVVDDYGMYKRVPLVEELPQFLIREEKKIIREKIRNNDLSNWNNNFVDQVCRINENEIYINDDKYDIVYNVNDLENIEIFVKDETIKMRIENIDISNQDADY